MPGKARKGGSNGEIAPNKLVSSAILLWENEGGAGVSARAVAGMAGLPVSSIYYHFGDIERLLETAQEEARAAAALWCEEQLAAIRGDVTGAAALGPLLAALIDDWCENRRSLAFAWRECQIRALRDPGCAPSADQWGMLWQQFWGKICTLLGIGDLATLTAWFFDGASALHLLRWRRPLDRAALDELCWGWAAWIDGGLSGPDAWFTLGQAEAVKLISVRELDDATAEAIAVAAAETIAQRGVAALTHRAVAAQAGVTLGVVSYKFRTIADLLHAAFHVIYRRMVSRAPMPAAVLAMGREEALNGIEGGVPERTELLASDELLVASARNPHFQAFAAQLRYLRGLSSGRYFQAIIGRERAISPLDGAIFSAVISGRSRAYVCGRRAVSSGDFGPLLDRLAGQGTSGAV